MKGGLHVTDVSNASRTLLMNIETLNWDPLLTKTFSVHPNILPEIRNSSDIVGPVNDGCILNGIPISGVRIDFSLNFQTKIIPSRIMTCV